MTLPLDPPAAASAAAPVPSLHGAAGDLVLIRIAADARHLEDVLAAVAELPFPVNPEIQHGAFQSLIEFPAYSKWVEEIRSVLEAGGLSRDFVRVDSVLA